MSLEPPGRSPSAGAADDDSVIPDRLERAPADVAIDTSEVMAVLLQAIGRYTNDDVREGAAPDDVVAAAPSAVRGVRHRHAAPRRGRRRLAGIVVALFFLVFGFGYLRLTRESSDKVTTKPAATDQTTTTLGPTSVATASTGPVPAPDPTVTAGGVPVTGSGRATTTTRRSATTAPRSTVPPSTHPASTAPDTTPSTEPTTTTTTTTAVPPCDTLVVPCP